MDYIKLNLQYSEETIIKPKIYPTEGEKIFARHSFDLELISEICKELIYLTRRKPRTQYKNGQKH